MKLDAKEVWGEIQKDEFFSTDPRFLPVPNDAEAATTRLIALANRTDDPLKELYRIGVEMEKKQLEAPYQTLMTLCYCACSKLLQRKESEGAGSETPIL